MLLYELHSVRLSTWISASFASFASFSLEIHDVTCQRLRDSPELPTPIPSRTSTALAEGFFGAAGVVHVFASPRGPCSMLMPNACPHCHMKRAASLTDHGFFPNRPLAPARHLCLRLRKGEVRCRQPTPSLVSTCLFLLNMMPHCVSHERQLLSSSLVGTFPRGRKG